MNALEFVMFLIISTFFAGLLTITALLFIRYRNTEKKLRQMTIDAGIISVEFQKLLSEKQSGPLEETQGFVKFISDSRDWAFTYIEDVQTAIEDYRKIADVVPISKDMTIEQAEQLSKAYDKLVDFLPTEEVNN
jgi:hypothetical protein